MLQGLFYMVAIVYMIFNMVERLVNKEESYTYKGPKNTKAQQKVIDEQMRQFLEDYPNHSFFDKNPQYKEKYLNEIDLSELKDALKK